MSPELAYFLKVNVAFMLFYAVYRLSFYKDTFFKLRRSILLVFFLLAFVYPLMNFQEWVKEQEPIAEVIQLYTAILPETIIDSEPVQTMDWQGLFRIFFSGAYWLVVAVLMIRFFTQLGSILWLALKSKQAIVSDTRIHILDKPSGPFSFFKLIFIHSPSHSDKEMDEILTHEKTHVSQWHSIDVIISELICISCWMNPFVWLLKREIRHNLEYLADNTVLQSGYDSKSYQYHLLGLAHHTNRNSANLYNSFNVLHLKNRIKMMNKKRSHVLGRTKYLIFIPLVALLMLLSNMEAVARITKTLATSVTEEMSVSHADKTVMTSSRIVDINNPPEANRVGSFQPEVPVRSTLELTDLEMTKEELQKDQRPVFTVVEEMPQFPGGDTELLKFLSKNIKYPAEAQERGIQVRVICSFVVNENGKITNTEITKGVDPLIDTEAVRVINTMPVWHPGKQKGQVVAVKYTVPVTFRLQSGKEEAPAGSLKPGDQTQFPSDQVFTVVEETPRFPGGDSELLKFISKNIKYPVSSHENGVQGRVICSFVVEKDGSLSSFSINKGVDPDLDKEALRVMQQSPDWIPGKRKGKAVRVKYTVPVTFRLQ